jgi:predicted nucleic acid-binding protein
LVRPTAIVPISRDPDDDQVLACALAAGADLIVSRDKDLLDLGTSQGIRILPAYQALATFPGRAGP